MIARRTLLRGAAALPIVGAVPAAASALSPNDARLVALADEYEALEREVDATSEDASGYDALVGQFSTLEAEAARTPADSLAGVIAKARFCQVPTARWCAANDHVLSAVDDLWRLAAVGALS